MDAQKTNADTSLTHDQIHSYVLKNFAEVQNKCDINELIHFHSVNKFLLMAHSQNDVVLLGKLVANKERLPTSIVFENYGIHLEKTLSKEPTIRTHSNVIQKAMGYFRKEISSKERKLALSMLSRYRSGQESLESILLFLDDLTRKSQKTYLVRQTYFLLYVRVKSAES